jgi:L,D-transpeptidase catalytic domain
VQRLVLGCTLVALTAAVPASAAAAPELRPAPKSAVASSAPPEKEFGFTRLSNERTHTSWAYIRKPVWVRKRPRYGARRPARLHTRTFAGSPDTVVVIGELRRRGKGSWSLVRYPGFFWRRGWVPTRALSHTFEVTTRLIIDRGGLRVRLRRKGKLVFRARIGVGKGESPTPAGRYYVRERLKPNSSGGIYGALAFGLSAYSPFRTDWPGGGQVGLHGTNQPHLIPGYISNGCIRLRNRDVRRLDRLMSVGTPVVIR